MDPEELRYAKTHEWIKVDGDIGTVGITDYAIKELGDIVFLELPEAGRKIGRGEPFGVIESVKAASDLCSPVSGEIKETNKDLEGNLKMLTDSPYQKGWMLKVKIGNPNDLNDLMSAEEYAKSIKEGKNQ